MNILIIGGTHFIGLYVTRLLAKQGHQITVFHRGQTNPNLPQGVNAILGDRTSLKQFQADFRQLAPDVVLDMIAYTEADAQAGVDLFQGLAKRIVVISSQDVYRARDIVWNRETDIFDPVPLTEASPLRSKLYPFRDFPPEQLNGFSPDYEKILVEQVYQNVPDLPATILRLPMVYGPGDYRHRLQGYLKRMDDHRPAIVLEESMAHWCGSYGYVENVAIAIATAITDSRATGRIYNISEPSVLSEADFITAIGQQAGWSGQVVSLPASPLVTPSKDTLLCA